MPDVTTEELERLVRDAEQKWRIDDEHGQLVIRNSYGLVADVGPFHTESYAALIALAPALAAEVLAGRKALEAVKADKCYCDAHQQVFSADEDLLVPCPHEVVATALDVERARIQEAHDE